MAPTPTKPARTERRIAQSSPYARPTAPLRTDASSSRDAPSGLRGFFSRLWGGKHKSSQPQVEPDQSAEESAVRAQSEDSDLVLVDAGPGKTATTEPVTKNNAGPPLRLPNASGWNDPPSFSTQNINMSTPVKKSVSLFDLGRHQGSPAAVNDLAEYFKLKSQRGETLTAEEAANVVQLVSSAQQVPESDFTFNMPPPPAIASPKMTSSTSLPSLSSMLKSPALKHSSATRGRLSYFGPGQSSSIRRTRPVVPIVASPSLPRPTPPITKPQEHEISTKKRRVQDSAQPFAFAQPSYIATPERKSTQKSSSMQGASASRIPTFSKPSSNGATPSPLKAALASKQSAAEKAAETSKAAPSPQKSTRAADLMRNIIQEEQASHPKSKMPAADILNPYASKEAAPLARIPRKRSTDKVAKKALESRQKTQKLLVEPDLKTQLEQSMPVEYRQALALARKEEALREERRKETEAVRQPSSSNITDPISLPPMPASTSKVQEKSDTPATASLSPTSTPQPVSIEPKGPSAASAPLQRIPSQQAAQPGKPSPAPAAATEAKSKSNAIVIDSDSDTDDDEVAVTSGPSKSTSKPAIPTRSPPPAAVLPKSSTSKVSPASAPGRVSEPAPAEASTSAASLRDTVAKMPVSQLPTSTWGFESFVGSSHQSGEDDEVLKVKAEVAALAADALPKYSFVVA